MKGNNMKIMKPIAEELQREEVHTWFLECVEIVRKTNGENE